MRVCGCMSGWGLASFEEGIQVLQQHINIQSMGIGTLFQAFILGTHAADTAQIVFLKDFDRIRMHPHYFKKSHIFCDRIRHCNLLWDVMGREYAAGSVSCHLHSNASFVCYVDYLVFPGSRRYRGLDRIIQLVTNQGFSYR